MNHIISKLALFGAATVFSFGLNGCADTQEAPSTESATAPATQPVASAPASQPAEETAPESEGVVVELPFDDGESWADYVDQTVTISGPLFVTETYNLGRYGQILLSPGKPLVRPTQYMEPSSMISALEEKFNASSITLDDGSNSQNPNPTPYISNGTIRRGDSVENLTGKIVYQFDEYMIIPEGDVAFKNTNPRNENPPAVEGDVKVVSFNVLNYFNGDGEGGGFPTERGADNPEEFERQEIKIQNAIMKLDADIVGLMEIENDGYTETSAIAELTSDLNGMFTVPEDDYEFVEPTSSVGTDAISCGILYRPSVVTLIGEPVTLNTGVFSRRRPPVIASFKHNESGEEFTVSVNHFKSKGCSNSSGQNADQGDGQGCYNYERVQAAQELMAFLKTYPTGIEDDDILVLGDLNSGSNEDPIQAFVDEGWVDLIDQYIGKDVATTYVYRGFGSVLDHMLASPDMVEEVSGIGIWSINSAEPRIIDYNTEYKEQDLTDDSPFRSSDHDPVLVGLDF